MLRGLLITVSAAAFLLLAGGAEAVNASAAQGAQTKGAQAAPGTTTPATTPAAPTLAGSVTDSGFGALIITDSSNGTATYEVHRTAGSPPTTSVFRLPKGVISFVDPTTVAGTTYSYTLYTVSAQGVPTLVTTQKAVPLVIPAQTALATPTPSTTRDFADRSKWLPGPKGNWLPVDGATFSQADDSQVGPLIFQEKAFWIGAPALGTKAQISAAITLQNWNTVTNLASSGLNFPLPPSFRFGIGFSTKDAPRAGVFVVIKSDTPNPTGVIEDDSGNLLQQISIDNANWKPGDTIRLKFRIEHAANAPQAAVKAKVWHDGQPEPDDNSYSQPPVNWPWPANGTVVPALFGGVQLLGNSQVQVNFTDVLLEIFPAPAAPAAPGSTFMLPRRPSAPLVVPALDEPVLIAAQAITSSGITRWGTLIGRVEPDAPLKASCPPRVCPELKPFALQSACCGGSRAVVNVVSTWNSLTGLIPVGEVLSTGPIVTPFPGGDIFEGALPLDAAIIPGANAIELSPGRISAPVIESAPLQLEGPQANRLPIRDASLRRTSLTADEITQAPAPQPTAPAPDQGAGPAHDSTPQPPDPNIELRPMIGITRRALRDFGAVATVPDAQEQSLDPAMRSQNAVIDALILELAGNTPFNPPGIADLSNLVAVERFTPVQIARARVTVDGNKQDRIRALQQIVRTKNDTNWTSGLKSAVLNRLEQYKKKDNLPLELAMLFVNKLKTELGVDKLPDVDKLKLSKLFDTLALESVGYRPTEMPWPSEGSDTRYRPTAKHDPIAFEHSVQVRRIDSMPADSEDEEAISSSYLEQSSIGELRDTIDGSARVWTYHFDHPARFPKIKFGVKCCAFESEGVVIHEGMRFLARQDGQYQVRFNITTPSIPVVLRLQMILFEKGRPDPMYGKPIPRTLTLPPIVIESIGPGTFPADLEAGIRPTTYLVSVRGYSQLIKEAQDAETPGGSLLLVKRIGTARIGSGVQYQATQ